MTMTAKSSASQYGTVTKSLHWIIFVLFTIMFILGFGLMGGDETTTAFGADWDSVFDWHATIGLIVLILAIIRIIWRKTTPLPSWAPGLTKAEQGLAHRTEQVMYFVMIAKPVSGYVLAGSAAHHIDLLGAVSLGNPFGENSGLEDAALVVHIITGVAFLVVWVIHVGQALRHQFGKKDHLLERMLPGRSEPATTGAAADTT